MYMYTGMFFYEYIYSEALVLDTPELWTSMIYRISFNF